MQIDHIDFSQNLILTCGNDDLITIFDMEKRNVIRKLHNKIYGCKQAIFTHDRQKILCASDRDCKYIILLILDRIIYWCLSSNKIISSFLGHSDTITNLNLNSTNDCFISTSLDKSTNIWDLKEGRCIYTIANSNCAAFDVTGKVIYSARSEKDSLGFTCTNIIEQNLISSISDEGLYEIINYSHPKGEIITIKISENFIYCQTDFSEIVVFDIYENSKIISKNTFSNDLLRSDISPDFQYISAGTDEGEVDIWNLEKVDSSPLIKLESHYEPVCVKFSPDFAILASSCCNLVLWTPTKI